MNKREYDESAERNYDEDDALDRLADELVEGLEINAFEYANTGDCIYN